MRNSATAHVLGLALLRVLPELRMRKYLQQKMRLKSSQRPRALQETLCPNHLVISSQDSFPKCIRYLRRGVLSQVSRKLLSRHQQVSPSCENVHFTINLCSNVRELSHTTGQASCDTNKELLIRLIITSFPQFRLLIRCRAMISGIHLIAHSRQVTAELNSLFGDGA